MPNDSNCLVNLGAEQVLSDFKFALEQFERDAPAFESFRVQWVGLAGLIRLIGEVLKNIDLNNEKIADDIKEEIRNFRTNLSHLNPENREQKKISDKSKEVHIPNPEIYWKFLREYPNSLLHSYKFGARQGFIIGPSEETAEITIKKRYYTITTGYYRGRDAIEVMKEVVVWWEDQLNAIKTRALLKR